MIGGKQEIPSAVIAIVSIVTGVFCLCTTCPSTAVRHGRPISVSRL